MLIRETVVIEVLPGLAVKRSHTDPIAKCFHLADNCLFARPARVVFYLDLCTLVYLRGNSNAHLMPMLTAHKLFFLFFFSPKLSYVPFVLARDHLGKLVMEK